MLENTAQIDVQAGLTALDNLLKRQDVLLEGMKRGFEVVDPENVSATVSPQPIPEVAASSQQPSGDLDKIDAMIAHLEFDVEIPDDSPYFECGEDAFKSFASEPAAEKKHAPLLRGRRITGVLFYLALVAVVVMTMSFIGRNNTPHDFLGYSSVSILTDSMQSKIPQGSLVLTKRVAPGSLQVGNDITFMYSATTSVTHEIVTIYENYNNTGQRGFQTKGVENPEPDKAIVPAGNVVGKVVWHVPAVGAVLQFVAKNVLLVMGCLAGIGVLLYLLYINLRWMFRSTPASLEDTASPLERNNPSPPLFLSNGEAAQRVEVMQMRA
ncbi:MAG: signal peptidase I [Coriobacteriia bacterium]|nr:signal peptidase I [Coriobacteriia bacterium]